MPRRIVNARRRWFPSQEHLALEFGNPMPLMKQVKDRLSESYMELVFQLLSYYLLAYGLWISVLGLRIETLNIA
jgi:hypothetical protein